MTVWHKCECGFEWGRFLCDELKSAYWDYCIKCGKAVEPRGFPEDILVVMEEEELCR